MKTLAERRIEEEITIQQFNIAKKRLELKIEKLLKEELEELKKLNKENEKER